jgi:hypothetical protein
LGRLKSCVIGHDNTGAGPAWHLAKVEVGCSKEAGVVAFPCGRWIRSEEAGVQPWVELFPGSGAHPGTCR